MTRHCWFTFLAAIPVAFCASLSAAERQAPSLADYIRPLVGTQGGGNTYPGPTAPFGMVQLSPDTDKDVTDAASGYVYEDKTILGFSLTHLSGTGVPDLGDFLFMPQTGKPEIVPGVKTAPDLGYQSRFAHADEAASAGYYRVKLLKPGVSVELSAAPRAGIMRMTFPQSDQASILTDLSHLIRGRRPWKVVWSHVRVEAKPGHEARDTVTGFHLVNGWGKERYLYFAAKYSRPFDQFTVFSDGKPVVYDTYRFRSNAEAFGPNLQFLAKYKTKKNEAILVKAAVSAVSAANALKNLDAEIPQWDFEKVRRETRAAWDKELGRIEVQGSQEDKETFYTAMYHAFTTPNVYQDVTGEYRGLDQAVHQAKNGRTPFVNYAVYSLWDTFRAEHPLFALIQQPRDADMINSMLAHYDQSVEHLLPIWSLQGNETWCMVGYHAVAVIADAYLKGVRGFDAKRAYQAMKTTATNPHYDNLATYAKLGWVPFDKENESVSKTLEYAYDDYCIARMAKALGKKGDYKTFMKRAGSFRNVFDPSIGLMRGKDSHGHWRTPYDPHLYFEGCDFTEGTAWQYSWYVPQDVPGLIGLMGGREKFTAKLDQLFTFPANTSKGVDDIQGRIGEYWHGNEPSHHIIYLYCYAGEPWKAQARLHEVIRTQYGNKPDSLSGNDDCGQMSAWYIFTALGFYPVCPASDYYVLGSPALPQATVHLSNGKTLLIAAQNLSAKNIYVQSLVVNGKPWTSPFLPHREIKDGGHLIFTMGPEPNKQWGVEAKVPE